MNKSTFILSIFLPLALVSLSAVAQPPGGFGGPPPGGGFGGGFGGPPGGMSSSRGGDRGGGDRGGGDRSSGSFGGDRGGFGGSSGGFDPSSFLTRMDTNGNGMLDPDEAQGPARFMLDRMARNNPKIDVTKPIPMSVLTESFQQMRSGSSSYGSSYGSSYSDEESPILEKNSLVPGFSTVKVEKAPVAGFGASGEKFQVQLDERDLKEADDRMQRYDKNNDQYLDENELKEGRWSDSPMQYDKNRDGKLSRQELATRYARRRLASGSQPEQAQRRDDPNAKRARDNRDVVDDKKEKANPFKDRASYRTTDTEGKTPTPAGLPEWFTRNDANSDTQVAMSEFIKKWNQDEVEDYYTRFDTNRDGFITVKECLVAVKKGFIPGAASASSSAPAPASLSSASDAAKPTDIPKASSGATSSSDAKWKDWVGKKLKEADKDGNGSLSPDEFTTGKFADVDTNKDGRIDVDELLADRLKGKK